MTLALGHAAPAHPQQPSAAPPDRDLLALARTDLGAFAREVSRPAGSDVARADLVVRWLGTHLQWTATDYQPRTVAQILERGGGNCNELAMVATAAFAELGLRMRKVREINVHRDDPARGERARALVEQKGLRLSVFGRRHNDHAWLEIFDDASGEWHPADPSIGIVGLDDWLQARTGFGPRVTLNPLSDDMIVPFAVLADDGTGAFAIDRTSHYLVDAFDRVHGGALHTLPAWAEWAGLLRELTARASLAFRGDANLHESEAAIARLGEVYGRLREQYAAR